MTREQAQELIAKAITEAGPFEGTLGTAAFAARLAIALEALGMLQNQSRPATKAKPYNWP